jgi:lipopolysaccharide transport system permease protein
MKGRWPEQTGGAHTGFALILFIGLIVHGFFAECLTRSATLVVSNTNFVKRVIFPLEILPWPMIISALFHAFMNILVYVILTLVVGSIIPLTIFILPIVLIPLVILSAGISWIFAALGVYFRDLSQVTGVLATALLFTSSAMIPVATLPPKFRRMFELNPLTFIIDQAREVALWGRMPNWQGLLIYAIGALVFTYAGYAWFVATKKGFADVL